MHYASFIPPTEPRNSLPGPPPSSLWLLFFPMSNSPPSYLFHCSLPKKSQQLPFSRFLFHILHTPILPFLWTDIYPVLTNLCCYTSLLIRKHTYSSQFQFLFYLWSSNTKSTFVSSIVIVTIYTIIRVQLISNLVSFRILVSSIILYRTEMLERCIQDAKHSITHPVWMFMQSNFTSLHTLTHWK